MKKLRCALCGKRIYTPKSVPISSIGAYCCKKNRPVCLGCRGRGVDKVCSNSSP